MDAEIPECDCCHSAEGRIVVDSAIGLGVWNQLHPNDQRTELRFCSDGCVFAHGMQLGRRWRETGVRVRAPGASEIDPPEVR